MWNFYILTQRKFWKVYFAFRFISLYSDILKSHKINQQHPKLRTSPKALYHLTSEHGERRDHLQTYQDMDFKLNWPAAQRKHYSEKQPRRPWWFWRTCRDLLLRQKSLLSEQISNYFDFTCLIYVGGWEKSNCWKKVIRRPVSRLTKAT